MTSLTLLYLALLTMSRFICDRIYVLVLNTVVTFSCSVTLSSKWCSIIVYLLKVRCPCLLVSVPAGDTAGSCGDPGIPSHGSREQTDFKIRSKVYFTCSEGFDLIGSSERMCFPNGTWSGTQPFCKRKKKLKVFTNLLY